MVGKVALFKTQLDGDNQAKQLSSLYDTWWRQRNVKEAEWRELRNYLFATDTTKTTNSSLPWKNTTTIPKLTQIRDNLHANYMDALFPNDDWLRWEGFSSDDVVQKKRRAIEAYMKNKLRESGFRETISKLLHDYIDYGNVFAEVEWVNEKHVDPVTQEEITTYIGPKVFRISPFDLVFNPVAPSFSESPKFVRYLMNVGELEDYLTKSGNVWNDQALTKVKTLRKSLSSFKMEDVNKSEAYLIDGFGSLFEYYQSGLVEVLVFSGDYYDETADKLKKRRIVTIVDRQYIVQDLEDPSWFGEDNKVNTCWRERPDNLYGMGPLDNLVGMQYRVDHLENLKADALDQTILPPKVIVGDVEPFEWGPGVNIHVSEDGDVRTLPPDPMAFQVNNEIAGLLQLMEEMAGAPKEAMGIRTPGEKTAFEVQQLQNAAGRIFQNKVNKFEIEFLEKVLNKMLEVARRKMSVSDLVKVMDDDLGVVDFMEVSKDDLTGKGKLRPIGARHYAARAQLMQNVVGVFNGPIGQMIMPHVSPLSMAKMVEEYMGFERFKIIRENAAIAEQTQTQRMINEAQTTLQTEASAPVEEKLLG